MEFGSILRRLRIEAGLTQTDLADELNVTSQAISKWERGDNYPDITLLPRLASRFQVSVDMLLGNEKPLSPDELRVLFDKCQDLMASGMIEKAISLTQEAVDRDNGNQQLKLALADLLVQISEQESDVKKRDAFLRRAAALLEAVIAAADDPQKKLETEKSLMRIWYRLGQKDKLFEMTAKMDGLYRLISKTDYLGFFRGNDRVFAAQGVIHDAAIEILQGLNTLTDDNADGKPVLSPLVSEEKGWGYSSEEKQKLLLLGINLYSKGARRASMEYTDVVVIGAGVLGCFAARALREKALSVLVLEAREDVCTGITKANTGIVYTGCDTKPGTLKTELCVRANLVFERLCADLDVRFHRCGSLMLAFGPRAEAVLRRKLENGRANGVPGIRLMSREETLAMEPRLSSEVTMSLYAPGTGTVNPWELGIAAFENARSNGAVFRFQEEVTRMARTSKGYLLETAAGQYAAHAVVNCAGLNAAAVRELTKIPAIRIFPSAGDYLVLDDTAAGFVRHVISHEAENKGKGLTLTPTVDGNLLVGPTERDRETSPDGATNGEALRELVNLCAKVVPELAMEQTIRSFSALRPNPFHVQEEGGVWIPENRSISNFTIMAEDGLFSLVGIKTPGLTCASELGKWVAKEVCAYLGDPGPNPDFNPIRKGIPRVHDLSEEERDRLIKTDAEFGKVVCHCRDVTQGEVLEAIRRGASTLDGVKRRTGAGMGRCQGGRCLLPVLEALAAEKGFRPTQVTKSGGESYVVTNDEKS